MKKRIITLVLLFVGFSVPSFTQEINEFESDHEASNYSIPDESKLYEDAFYQVKHKGETAYTTDISAIGSVFNVPEYMQIKAEMLRKEGIFKVELLADQKVLRVYHLSYIEIETIKSFVLPYKTDFHPGERQLFQMN